MFVGTFEHQLDDKGRVVLPAKFREFLAVGGYVTQGRGKCLAIWTAEGFEQEAAVLRDQERRGEIDRNVRRATFANTFEIKPDSQGRVQIPGTLRTYAGLASDVTITGNFDSIEIWDRATWSLTNASGSTQMAEQ